MAKLKFNVRDEFMEQIKAEADRLWSGQGIIAMRRLVRDSVRRLWRYSRGNGKPTGRGRHGSD